MGAEQVLGGDRVLVVAEQILELPCGVGDAERVGVPRCARELDGVADAFHRQPEAVEPVRVRPAAGRADIGHESLEVAADPVAEGAPRRARGCLDRLLQRGEQPAVPGLVECTKQLVPQRASLALELLARAATAVRSGAGRRRRFALEPAEQHVEVAQRARDPPESRELGADRLGPGGIDELAAGAERRAQPPAGDAVLVEVLRICPQAHARIVGE